MNDHSEKDRNKIEKYGDLQVFFIIRVNSKKDQKTDTGTIQQTGDQMARGEHSVEIHLRQKNGHTTVRDQSDQCGNKKTEDGPGSDDSVELVLTEKQKAYIQNNSDEKDKDDDMQRMLQGRSRCNITS